MQQVVNLYKSSIGKKVVMAVTGGILVGFVFVHMLGNLKLYQNPEKLDAYGEFLREVGYPVLGHGEVPADLFARIENPPEFPPSFESEKQGSEVNRGGTGGCWSGKRDSNPRPSAWEADALPTELFPQKDVQPTFVGGQESR